MVAVNQNKADRQSSQLDFEKMRTIIDVHDSDFIFTPTALYDLEDLSNLISIYEDHAGYSLAYYQSENPKADACERIRKIHVLGKPLTDKEILKIRESGALEVRWVPFEK